jgi:pentatricopeptide repeat protein
MKKKDIIYAIEILTRVIDALTRAGNPDAAKRVTDKILELTDQL